MEMIARRHKNTFSRSSTEILIEIPPSAMAGLSDSDECQPQSTKTLHIEIIQADHSQADLSTLEKKTQRFRRKAIYISPIETH